mmetsp:Transcript_4227/g.15481  ORF Transcript_4227/g.15481 Transcript_4227/m.15481 type:complete len:243 (+) Transcript_4227:139-867(+)
MLGFRGWDSSITRARNTATIPRTAPGSRTQCPCSPKRGRNLLLNRVLGGKHRWRRRFAYRSPWWRQFYSTANNLLAVAPPHVGMRLWPRRNYESSAPSRRARFAHRHLAGLVLQLLGTSPSTLRAKKPSARLRRIESALDSRAIRVRVRAPHLDLIHSRDLQPKQATRLSFVDWLRVPCSSPRWLAGHRHSLPGCDQDETMLRYSSRLVAPTLLQRAPLRSKRRLLLGSSSFLPILVAPSTG